MGIWLHWINNSTLLMEPSNAMSHFLKKRDLNVRFKGLSYVNCAKTLSIDFLMLNCLMPSQFLTQAKLPCSFEVATGCNYGNEKADTLSKHFVSLDHQALRIDWTNFRTYMIQCCKDTSMQAVMSKLATNATMHQIYPELSKLAQICLIILVSIYSRLRERV